MWSTAGGILSVITGELAFRYVTYILRYASWTHSSCTYSCRTSERYRQEMPSPKSGGQTVLDETELQARISVCRGCDERVRPLFEDARSLQSLCKLVITCTMRLGAERELLRLALGHRSVRNAVQAGKEIINLVYQRTSEENPLIISLK